MKTLACILLTALSVILAFAQPRPLIVQPNIALPADSIEKVSLLHCLNGFIAMKDSAPGSNVYVLREALPGTTLLLDEMKNMEKSRKYGSDTFYKGYLSNVVKADNGYLIQCSYIGLREDNPLLRAIFTLRAEKRNDTFFFCSPVDRNTRSWKKTRSGSATLHSRENGMAAGEARKYLLCVQRYDRKLQAPSGKMDCYCCDDGPDALRLFGVDYKSDYNGRASGTYSAHGAGKDVVVLGSSGNELFDPHDLWHSRLRKVMSASVINRPVDEGAAYLYGGSWGFSWEQILSKFKTFALAHPGADWLELYNKSLNFDERGKYPLNVDFAINALIIRKVEKEKGFEAVRELLSCGPKEEGNANYFRALESVAGITKNDFNRKIDELIAMQ